MVSGTTLSSLIAAVVSAAASKVVATVSGSPPRAHSNTSVLPSQSREGYPAREHNVQPGDNPLIQPQSRRDLRILAAWQPRL